MENDLLKDAALIEIVSSGSSSRKYSYAVVQRWKKRPNIFLRAPVLGDTNTPTLSQSSTLDLQFISLFARLYFIRNLTPIKEFKLETRNRAIDLIIEPMPSYLSADEVVLFSAPL